MGLFKKAKKAEVTNVKDCAVDVSKFTSIADFKDIHKGKRCFIVGNGPSLTFEDLDKLQDEITFGVNKVYLGFDRTKWRPTYYALQDERMALQIHEQINQVPLKIKFISNQLQNIFKKNESTFYFNYMRRLYDGTPAEFSFEPDKVIFEGATIAFTCLQLALFMGISEVYLIGVDLNYSVQNTEDGVEVNNVKDYFVDGYISYSETRNFPNVHFSKQSYECAKKAYEEKGARIYNATRGGKLEIFERVDFDMIAK